MEEKKDINQEELESEVVVKKESKFKKFFKFNERKTDFKKEIIGGLITFLSMCYILMVNPDILGGAGMPKGGVFLATALVAGVSCIAMGLLSNLPFAIAPGMGTNAFFTFTVVHIMGYTWQEALAAGILGGLLFLIISVTPLRKSIIKAIPVNLRYAIGAGIGFFIAFIGLKNAGIVVSNPGTYVGLTDFKSPATLLALFGIVLAIILRAMNFKYTIITSLGITGIVGIILSVILKDPSLPSLPSAKDFLELYKDLGDIKITASGFVQGFASKGLWKPSLVVVIISFTFVDMFDTLGTFVACADKAGLIDENGEIENSGKAMIVDSAGTFVGNMLGTPVVTTYVESSSGIEAGARTGFSSVIVGILFLISIAIYPVFSIFGHSSVTSLALVLVGISMSMQLKRIEWNKIEVAIYSFLTIIIMTLTFSIANGIAFGFIFYTISKMAQGKFKDVHLLMYSLSGIFIAYYMLLAGS